MSTKINLKDKKLPLTAIFIIVFGYASERMAEIANFEKTKAFALALGGIMTVLFVLSAALYRLPTRSATQFHKPTQVQRLRQTSMLLFTALISSAELTAIFRLPFLRF